MFSVSSVHSVEGARICLAVMVIDDFCRFMAFFYSSAGLGLFYSSVDCSTGLGYNGSTFASSISFSSVSIGPFSSRINVSYFLLSRVKTVIPIMAITVITEKNIHSTTDSFLSPLTS